MISSGNIRCSQGTWAARFRPDPYSAYKRKWEISGACPSPANIKDASVPPAGLDWTPVTFDSDFINFHQVHPNQGGLVYARGRVDALCACRLNVLLGTDGQCKLWVDGKVVGLVENAENPARPNLNTFPLRLETGVHEVIIGFERRGGSAWGFFFRLMSTAARFTREERTTMAACLPLIDA